MCHRHARDRGLLAQLIEDMGLPSSAHQIRHVNRQSLDMLAEST